MCVCVCLCVCVCACVCLCLHVSVSLHLSLSLSLALFVCPCVLPHLLVSQCSLSHSVSLSLHVVALSQSGFLCVCLSVMLYLIDAVSRTLWSPRVSRRLPESCSSDSKFKTGSTVVIHKHRKPNMCRSFTVRFWLLVPDRRRISNRVLCYICCGA